MYGYKNAQAMAPQASEDFWFSNGEPMIYSTHSHQSGSGLYCTFVIANIEKPQSNELTRGTTELFPHFRLIGGVHIEARALLDINFIWFGYIAHLFQKG